MHAARTPARRRGILVASSLSLIGALTACAAPDASTSTRWEGLSFADAMSACLQERGWDSQPNADGSYDTEVLPEQSRPYDHDRQACMEETGYAAEPEALTRDELETWYRDLLSTAECVRDLGYEIDEAPSAQVFLDQVESGDLDGLWGPYPGNLSSADFAALEAACPQPGAEAPQQWP